MSTSLQPAHAVIEQIKVHADAGSDPLWIDVRDGKDVIGHLESMPAGPRVTTELAVALTDARNREPGGFASRFTATPERPRRWLDEVIRPDPTRILLLGRDLRGEPIGHVGLMNIWNPEGTAEFDNLIRVTPRVPGYMMLAFRAMVEWAGRALGVSTVLSYPLADNEKTMRFHRRAGFALTQHQTLFEIEIGGGEFRWVPRAESGAEGVRWTGRTREMYRGVLPIE